MGTVKNVIPARAGTKEHSQSPNLSLSFEGGLAFGWRRDNKSAFSTASSLDPHFQIPLQRTGSWNSSSYLLPAIQPSLALNNAHPETYRTMRIFVAKFSAYELSESLAEKVSDMASNRLAQWRPIEVQTFQDISAKMGIERMRDLCGEDVNRCDADILSEIAGALGVDFLMTGSVSLLGGNYVVNFQIVDDRMDIAPARQQFHLPKDEENRFIGKTAKAVDGLMQNLTSRLKQDHDRDFSFQIPQKPDIPIEDAEKLFSYRPFFWTSAGLGATALLLGAIGIGIASKSSSDHSTRINDLVESGKINGTPGNYRFIDDTAKTVYGEELENLEEKVNAGNTMAAVGLVGGALFTASAGLFFWLDQSEAKDPEESITPTGNARFGFQSLSDGGIIHFVIDF